ncbi:MAG: hypothetical protein H6662_13840 [Ardenticatenaceae bacterium]|nr:hypothetical protein [Anaerolineales bacterium]MCB8922663.1 hypothetical protein [Ardenticatenaceae bacterium]MCB9003629.1 hypothetical protein [Ardenticatenaceae bacterium]
MKKLSFLWLILFLAACAQSAPVNNQEVGSEEAAADVANATAVSTPGEVETAVPATAPTNGDTITPATTAEEAAVIRPEDWVSGAADPLVTIIEYGDFQ